MKKALGVGVVCLRACCELTQLVWPRLLPLTVVVDGARATAHMELLGEYPNETILRLLELVRLDISQVIWRVVADEELVQIHQVQFVAGANAADLRTSWGRAKTDIPSKFLRVSA